MTSLNEIRKFEKKHNPLIDEKFHQLNLGNIGNVVYWSKFFEMTKNVQGDIVECGIGRGRSLLIISALNSFLNKNEGGNRKIFGYDSFEGFPNPTIEDKSFRSVQKGEWSKSPSGKYEYTKSFINQILTEADIDTKDLSIIKGFFDESLPKHPKQPIAILHIDADLYQSHKVVLNSLYDLVESGGVIIFDDVLNKSSSNERFPGAKKAVEEFFSKPINSFEISIRGNYYYVKP